jgi:hypothetical protein
MTRAAKKHKADAVFHCVLLSRLNWSGIGKMHGDRLALHEKYLDEEDISRKGAKRYRVSKGFSLRLCGRHIFLFRASEYFSCKAAQTKTRILHNRHLVY